MKITPINYSNYYQTKKQTNDFKSHTSNPNFEGAGDIFKKRIKLAPDAVRSVISISHGKIKKVAYEHVSLLKHSNYSFDDIREIYHIAAKSSDKMKLMGKLAHSAYDADKKTKLHPTAMKDFLKSGYSVEYNRNFEKYVPYIELHAEEPYMAKSLEQELDMKTFKAADYKRKYDLQNLVKKHPQLEQYIDNNDVADFLLNIKDEDVFKHNQELISEILADDNISIVKLNENIKNAKRIFYIYENRSNNVIRQKLTTDLENTQTLKKRFLSKKLIDLKQNRSRKDNPLIYNAKKVILNIRKFALEIKDEILL